MRKIYLLFLMLLIAFTGIGQNIGTIQVGSGTTTHSGSTTGIPFTNYHYSYTQHIVTASEYANGGGASGNITKIRLRFSAPGTFNTWNGLKIYMANTTKTEFATTSDWVPFSDLTQVFNYELTPLTVVPVANEWYEITLSTPFAYTGGNFVVTFHENLHGYVSTPTIYNYTSTTYSGMVWRSDTANIDPTTSFTANGRTSTLPQMQFEGTLASCVAPTGIQFFNSLNSAGVPITTVTWTPNANAVNHDWIVVANNAGPTATPIASGSGAISSAVITGLTESTEYDFYIKTNCGVTDGISIWSPKQDFSGACSADVVPYTIPLDATSGTALPACVTVQNLNGDATTWVTAAAQTGITGRVMSLSANATLASNDWFYTKGLNLTANQVYKLNFKYRKATAAATQKLKVKFGSSPLENEMTNLITDITISDQVVITSDLLTYYFVPSVTGVYYLGFNGYAEAAQGTLYVGQVSVELGPSCVVPGDVNLTAVTKNSATINWIAPVVLPTNGYEYEIRTAGDPGSGAVGLAQAGTATSSELFKNITGLTPSTEYKVYMRSLCSATSSSDWTVVKTFTTLCNYPDFISAPAVTRCGTGLVNLTANYSSNEYVFWYDSITGGVPLHTGVNYSPTVSEPLTSFYVSAGLPSPNTQVQIGTGTALSTAGGESPFYYSYGGYKHQYIYTAEELLASGLMVGPINSLAFNVVNASSVNRENFTIYIGTTTQNVATTTHVSGLQLFYSNASQPMTAGINPYQFTQPFIWDGVSNIVVQINWSNNNGGSYLNSGSVAYSSTGVAKCTYTYADNRTAEMILATLTGGVPNAAGTSTSGGTTTSTSRANIYFNGTAICESPRTEVVATVTPAPVLTLSHTEVDDFCEGDSVLITVTEGATNFVSYVWEPATGVAGDVATGWTFNPTVSTVYTLTALQTTGDLCAQVIDVDFVVKQLPDYTPLEDTSIACVDEVFELNTNLVNLVEVVVGTDTTLTGPTETNTAFDDYWRGTKQQYIYTKAELNALGVYEGQINAIGFEIATPGSSLQNADYTLKIKTIAEESFTSNSYLTGDFVTVYGPAGYDHTNNGWQIIEFTTPFYWDGEENLVIEFTHRGSYGSSNATTYYSTTSDYKALVNYTTTTGLDFATLLTGTRNYKRLNCKFVVDKLTEVVWSPTTNLYLDEAATQPYAGEIAEKVYFNSSEIGVFPYSAVLSTPYGCELTETTSISVIDVTEPIVTDQSICFEELSNVVATGLMTGSELKWYASETSDEEIFTITESGTYFVEQVVGTCKSARVSAEITLNLQLPAPVAPLDQKFCLDTVNTSYTVADLDATETTGTIGWFLNEDDTTPLASTTVLATGTYYVAEFNDTCWSPRTEVEVAIGTMPAVPNGASQAFCSSLTLADVEVGQVPGATVNWYASADATETLDTENPLTDATYYVSQIIGFCESERIPIQIQLIPVFDAPVAPSPVLYCQETTFDDLEVTLLPGGTKGWFTSIATAEPNIALTDVVTTGTYYVAQHNGACWSNKTAVQVTVNPTPADLNSTAQTLCGTFTLADAQLGQMEDAVVKFYASETSDEVLPMTNSLVTGTYYVSQTLNQCESNRITVQFTVHEILTAPVAPAVQFYCGTTTFADLDATPTTGTIGWFASEDAVTPLSSTANVSTGTYYVAQLNGTCWSPTSEVEVTVNQIPATLNDADQQLCGTFTLADADLDQVDGAEVRFFASETSTTPMVLTSPLVTGTYYVSQIVLGCESPRVAVSFVVNEILTAPVAPAVQFYCGTTTFADLDATPTTGTIGWFASEDGTTPLSATASVSTGVYYVAQLNGQCWSPRTQVTVSVNPIPASLNNASQQLCGTFTLADAELGQAENAVVFFYASATSPNILPSTNSLLTGTYYVSQMVLGCESPRVAVNFVVNEILAAPQAPSVQSYCGATTFADLSATPTTGTIGWFASENGTAPLNMTASVSTGVYYVAQLNGQCWSPRTIVNVTVNPEPAAPSNATIQLCGNYNFGQVSIGQISGATIKWYATETSTTPINPGTNVVTGTYYVSQTVGGCESERVMVTIFQTDALSNPIAVSQTFCGSATVADLVAQGMNGTIVWYNSSVALNPLSPNAALSTGTYYAAQTLNGCFSSRVPISVFVVSVAAPNVDSFNFCGSATVANLVLPTPSGVTYKWFDSPSNPMQLDSNAALVTGTYFVSRTQYGCESLRTPVSVVINTVPNAPTGVSPQNFMEGATISDIVMDQSNVVWYISEQNAQNGINPLVQGMPLVNGTTYYGVIIGTNGCPSLPFALTVDVYLSDDRFVKEELKYYPNPVEDLLTISYSDRILQIEVFDLLGKRVKVKSTDDKEVNIDLSDLASGTYMIQLKTENKAQFIKIIKK